MNPHKFSNSSLIANHQMEAPIIDNPFDPERHFDLVMSMHSEWRQMRDTAYLISNYLVTVIDLIN